MSPTTRAGLGVLAAGLILGVAADVLLRSVPWGVNLTIWSAGLVAAGAVLVRRHRVPVTADATWLALTVVLLAGAYVRRASPWLQTLDLFALMGALGLLWLAPRGVRLQGQGALTYLVAPLWAAGQAVSGTFDLMGRSIRWEEVLEPRTRTLLPGLALGLVLGAPLVIVFGGLFASADSVFASAVGTMFAMDLGPGVSHAVVIGSAGALSAGYVGSLVLPRGAAPAGSESRTPAIGVVPVATVLALLVLLFLSFVAVQLRYLFGGERFVLETTGLTLAEYARKGFLELVTASALLLPILLVADWVTAHQDGAGRRLCKQLTGVLLGLLAVVTVSAFERLRLYVAAFGLSEIRLYAAAAMVYLCCIWGWFAATVLRERRDRFTFGALVQGWVVLAALHVANPDAVITRVNLDRAGAGHALDAAYVASSLSADAVPTLLDRLEELPARERCDLTKRVVQRWMSDPGEDWRSWNWSRARARRLVREAAPGIARACHGGALP